MLHNNFERFVLPGQPPAAAAGCTRAVAAGRGTWQWHDGQPHINVDVDVSWMGACEHRDLASSVRSAGMYVLGIPNSTLLAF